MAVNILYQPFGIVTSIEQQVTVSNTSIRKFTLASQRIHGWSRPFCQLWISSNLHLLNRSFPVKWLAVVPKLFQRNSVILASPAERMPLNMFILIGKWPAANQGCVLEANRLNTNRPELNKIMDLGPPGPYSSLSNGHMQAGASSTLGLLNSYHSFS